MNHSSGLQDDLRYVASAVQRHDTQQDVPAIYLLWGAIIGIGYALPDFAARWAGLYWLVAGPAGGIASWRLGRRHALQRGDVDDDMAWRYGAHWVATGVAFVLLGLVGAAGLAPIRVVAAQFLLIAALAYTLAGIHLNRPMLWSGVILFVGYAALSFLKMPYVWTLTGVLTAFALFTAAWKTRGRA